ncbi:MAG: tripartite tricarboxylate transporter substrate binding protein [Betaproteobacteria bacterium]|nr:tripartite tricarboxylate transporter substrate binding protein [Betaproteobacteria bacterium]
MIRSAAGLTTVAWCVTLTCVLGVGETVAASTERDYPSKPIRLILPHGAGSSADIFARLIGQKLSDNWSTPVVVDNRPGAGGTLGMQIAAKATPDGYTLVLTQVGSLAINPSIYKTIGYDTVKDFAPITRLAAAPFVLVVHPAVLAKSVAELIRIAKSKPDELNLASGGSGTGIHLAGELFKSMAAINIVHVPYKGAPPALTALLGGEVQMMFGGLPLVLPHVKSAKLRALGVTTSYRAAALPKVPTIAEAGLPDYVVEPWWGVLAPAGIPKSIVAKLNRGIVGILQTPQTKAVFAHHGAELIGDTPAQFAERIKAEMEMWAKVVKESGVRVE